MSGGTLKQEMTAVINRFGIEDVLKYAANEAAKRHDILWKENKKLRERNEKAAP